MNNTTKFIIGGMTALVLFALTVTFALAVSAPSGPTYNNACYNSDGLSFCGVKDETCTYKSYETGVEVIEADSDGDGWTDTCYAFPNDETETIDLDGDNCGHNVDTNDLDPEITCHKEDESESGDDGDSSSSDSSDTPARTKSKTHGGSWPDRCENDWSCTSDCEAGTISCIDLNSCDFEINKPTTPECPSNPVQKEGDKSPEAGAAAAGTGALDEPPQMGNGGQGIVAEPSAEPLPLARTAPEPTSIPAPNSLWLAFGLLILPFVPVKKCDSCGKRNALFRQKCKTCQNDFYIVRKGTILYKLRHVPFLMFKGFR